MSNVKIGLPVSVEKKTFPGLFSHDRRGKIIGNFLLFFFFF